MNCKYCNNILEVAGIMHKPTKRIRGWLHIEEIHIFHCNQCNKYFNEVVKEIKAEDL